MTKKVWFAGDANFHFLNDLIDRFTADGLVASSEADADIIWSEWASQGSVETVERNKGKAIVVRCHAYEIEQARIFTRIDWDSVSCLLFVSEVKQELFRQLYPDIGVRTACIPNALNTERFAPSRSWDCRHRIGMLGRINSNKGVMGALMLLRRLGKPWELHVKGVVGRKSGRYFMYIRMLRKLLGLGSRVHFLPFDSEPEKFLNSVDVILSNSRRESFHAVVAEGMCCGCLPVVRNWPGARQIYPGAAIFSTPAEFVERVKSYELQSNAQRKAVAESGREFVLSHFGVDEVYRQCRDLLDSL